MKWLGSAPLGRARAYFGSKLGNFSTVTPLAESLGGQIEPESSAYSKQINLYTVEDSSRIELFLAAHGLTLATLMHGAWALLLRRYTGHKDVLFGSILSGRPADMEGVENMVGHFNNILPFRLQVDEEDPVKAWLKKAQLSHVELHEYQHTPLHKIQDWIGFPLDWIPFQSYVVCENFPVPENLTAQQKSSAASPSIVIPALAQLNFPLRIEIFPGTQILTSMSHYHSVFDARKIGVLLAELHRVVLQFVERPDRSVKEFV